MQIYYYLSKFVKKKFFHNVFFSGVKIISTNKNEIIMKNLIKLSQGVSSSDVGKREKMQKKKGGEIKILRFK